MAFVAVPLIALRFDLGFALGLMSPLLMVTGLFARRIWWGKWDRRAAAVLSLGAVPGIGLGALFHQQANPDHLRLPIGLIAVGFSLWRGGAHGAVAAPAGAWCRGRFHAFPQSRGRPGGGGVVVVTLHV